MKKIIIFLLLLSLLLALGGCQDTKNSTPSDENEKSPSENDGNNNSEKETQNHMLDGKRIIFIGDSFVYYGKVVLDGSPSREDDQGYFYELCRANGADVSVTNFTFGGKGITYIYENYLDQIRDAYYDYVIFSGGRNSASKAETYFSTLSAYMSFFREANPEVSFLYLVSSGAHNISVDESFPTEILNNLDEFEKMGITIVDWGKMVADIIRGDIAVPDGENTFDKNTFIVDRSDKDGYHPNQLTGYLTALMTYSAITGESAVGQPYHFWNDTSLDGRFSPTLFIDTYYTYGETNYPDVFASAHDMTALQELIDFYLSDKAYRDYAFGEE